MFADFLKHVTKTLTIKLPVIVACLATLEEIVRGNLTHFV